MSATTGMLATGKTIHGLLPVYKPKGMVSKDVSRHLVRRFGKLKLGHVGTLDPGAEGVLPILLGNATRLQDYLLASPKTYEFDITLGYETTTLDADGVRVKEASFGHVNRIAIDQALQFFMGKVRQIPPVYSAVKFKGKPLYEYARKGLSGELPIEDMSREIEIYELRCLGGHGSVWTLEVVASRGTYVRTLVKDLCERLQTCGTLTRLVRRATAGIAESQCHQLDAILSGENLKEYVVDLSDLVLPMPRYRLTATSIAKLRTGQQVLVDERAFESEITGQSAFVRDCDKLFSPILLTYESGRAFGLGAVQKSAPGVIRLNLQRGL